MILPRPIQAYFDPDHPDERVALVAAFAPDGVVRDEGQTHIGHPAIEAWRRDVRAKYQHVAEPLDWAEEREVHRVRAKVTGNFPGSPATLTFAFRLRGDRIGDLEIGA